MDLTSLIQGQLNDGLLDQLSQQLGGVDKQQASSAASGIMGTLMAALAKNASTPEGASALNNALERDHDGSILNDVMGMLTGQSQAANPRATNGSGILEHILGGKQSGAIDMISKMSGLQTDKTGNLMAMLAPVLMGMLGKAKRENGLDAGGLSDLLNGVTQQQQQANPGLGGLLTSFLDADGDGSIIDDLAGKLLGGLFGRR